MLGTRYPRHPMHPQVPDNHIIDVWDVTVSRQNLSPDRSHFKLRKVLTMAGIWYFWREQGPVGGVWEYCCKP